MAILQLRAPNLMAHPTSEPDSYVELHRIFCVGRNYAEHAREMGNDAADPPFFFMKPASAAVRTGASIPYPPATQDFHHEAELCVLIGREGADVPRADALSFVWGYAAGNDLTRRDLQAAAKAARRPWDMAKGFDKSAIIGDIHPVAEVGHPDNARITCTVDGALRQDASTADMIWPVADIIAYLSGLVTLQPGDLIMTGTPAGVGPLTKGQTCVVEIAGLSPATVTIAP
ncbi:fumarylacetoacetate hydrolase family protein [Octadecabacter sp. R77987]|uniref:fumarylacetoacetate hydrolase family protein n=1 Tax=Octadecabacter sp. R77987 TaxID=3093874 RepID=UPI003671CE88